MGGVSRPLAPHLPGATGGLLLLGAGTVSEYGDFPPQAVGSYN